jgi:hypothetical protein
MRTSCAGIKPRIGLFPMRRAFFLVFAAILLVPPPAGAETSAGSEAARAPGEALCGPEIVTVGDAWEHVRIETDALRVLLQANDLVRVPQITAALASHLSFMRNRSTMVWGEPRQKLLAAIGQALAVLPEWNRFALGGQSDALGRELSQWDAMLKAVAAQYPDEALISTNAAALLLPPAPLTLRIALNRDHFIPPQAGQEATVRFYLKDLLGKNVPPEALLVTHTAKLHALVLDPQFQDYHHAHPQPTGNAGEYEFRFTPQRDGPYRLWIDALPSATGREEFPFCDLSSNANPATALPKLAAAQMTAVADDFVCELSFPDGKVRMGEVAGAQLTIRDRDGHPVQCLQPTMGAFAHIVGFAADYKTVLHIHPLGAMPKPDDMGGPTVRFRFRPDLAGDLRLFVQFQTGGAMHVAGFATRVE